MIPGRKCEPEQAAPVPEANGALRGLPEVRSCAAAEETLSPSLLWPTKLAASYELKFLLRPPQAEDVHEWARQHLALDPHADAALHDAYRIRSVYFDTDQLDVAHQTPSYKRRKFRLRRYGTEHGVFLERKSKSGDRVRKRRTLISDQELCRLQEPSADPAWPGYWFQRRLLARKLKPRCLVSYERVAHVGMAVEGPVRMTLDRHIHCVLIDGCEFDTLTNGLPLLAEHVVLELKFRSAMPAMFKRLIQEMGLSPTGVSKYRLGIQAWGLTVTAKGVG